MFTVHGLLFASWTAHIALVKGHLGLTDGTLSLALLGVPIGSVSAIIVAGRLLPRLGSRRMVQACLIGYCLVGPAVGLAGSLPTLIAALFAWGVFQGSLDVSMNTQAIAVERYEQRPLMSGWHGCWSIGSLIGAGLGALGVAVGASLAVQLAVLGAPALALGWALTTRMRSDPVVGAGPAADGRHTIHPASRAAPVGADPGRLGWRHPGWGRPAWRVVVRRSRAWGLSGPVMVLGAIALADMLCEGATADWASVYLRGSLGDSATVAGLAYAVYSLTMVAVRLGGNRLLARYRPRRLLPVLALVGSVGFAAGLLGDTTVTALIGYAALGIGLASVVPTVFSAAGHLSGFPAGTALSTVAAFGWAGFVCAPPLIGALASAFSLPVALGLIPLLTAFVAIAAAAAPAVDGDRGGHAVSGTL